MTPIRANIVGPPDVATRIKSLHGRLPLLGLVLGLRKLRDVIAGVLERDKLATPRQRYRLVKRSFPPAIRRTIHVLYLAPGSPA